MTLAIPTLSPRAISQPIAAPPTSWRQTFQNATLFSAICILSGGFIPLGRFMGLVEVLDPGVSDPWANALEGFVLSMMLVSVFMNWNKIKYTLIHMVPCAALGLYCALSAVWSPDPVPTFRRSILLLLNLIFGPFGYSVRGITGSIRVMNSASWFMLFSSLLLFVTWPSVGQDTDAYAGALRGIFSQKNVAAWAYELALAYLGYNMYLSRRVDWKLIGGTLLIAACIVLTKSTTEVLSSILLCAFWAWSFWFRQAKSKLLPVWAGISLVVVFTGAILLLGNEVYTAIGKDAGLTGRSEIWALARRAIALHPIRGWGYQGFWTPFNPAAQEIWDALDWHAPHAHNGYLELLIEIGYFGVGLFAIVMGYLGFLIVSGLRRDSPVAWWTVSWMLLVIFRAHSEPAYFQIDMDTSLIAFSSVALGVERSLARRARTTSPPGAMHERLVRPDRSLPVSVPRFGRA